MSLGLEVPVAAESLCPQDGQEQAARRGEQVRNRPKLLQIHADTAVTGSVF